MQRSHVLGDLGRELGRKLTSVAHRNGLGYSLALAKGLGFVVRTYCSMKLLKEFWSIDNEQSRKLYLLKSSDMGANSPVCVSQKLCEHLQFLSCG